MEAFELDVIDYLVKPISLERLIKAINRYHERLSRGPGFSPSGSRKTSNTIQIYSDKRNHRVPVSSILYIEGLKDYAVVHTDQGRLITRQTMKNFEDILPDGDFIRIHRSYIVPIQRLDSWTHYSVNIKDKEIPVGRTYRKSIQDLLENLYGNDPG